MTQPSSHPQSASEPAMTAEADLLASIFSPTPSYPWEPLAPGAEAYLNRLDAAFDALEDEDLSAAIASGWQAFSQRMDDWQTSDAAPAIAPVQAQLTPFQPRLPAALLDRLAQTALAAARSGQPLIDQLVQCASDLLPAWDRGDLGVLARPLAYSLRDGRGEILDLNLRAIPEVPWETLSELDQARLTLAVASVALKAAGAQGGANGQPQ